MNISVLQLHFLGSETASLLGQVAATTFLAITSPVHILFLNCFVFSAPADCRQPVNKQQINLICYRKRLELLCLSAPILLTNYIHIYIE